MTLAHRRARPLDPDACPPGRARHAQAHGEPGAVGRRERAAARVHGGLPPRAAGLLILAKSPVPGRVKTRLCPPCTPGEACSLAEAMLADTLHAARAARPAWTCLVLDGAPGPWVPDGVEVVPQRPGDLGARLEGAFADAGTPALLIAYDTPQVTPGLLASSLSAVASADAVLGPADDGGYWAIGLRRNVAGICAGVPMSRSSTLRSQRRRLAALGLSVADLPPLRDVDRMADARAVARAAPGTRFAAALTDVERAITARRTGR
ncbi:TIGR04282 family arsenosugar biosynthesis glycosyltransferase [Actinomadura atramentaria]|uniref:TIGR04282 family arsenosugar biosynthesis glycosyltransferase n=1 Tax=Actinomadura atramentaria TaxID=1990 RepID=UPI000367FA89|nr:TIGR04282 family arsenosugar biosynthesis glycosyltransferase [Actinomadura atramentaria]